LGIIPVGTGNALARDFGIPMDVDGALDVLLGEHTIKRIDALQVGDRFFVLNIGVGVSAQIMRDTESDAKRRFGRMAYLWNIADKVFGLKRHRFTVTLDGQEKQLRATEILVLNSGALGSPYVRWGTDIHLDDGQVEVYVLRPRAVLDYFSIAWDLLRGQRQGDPSMRCLSATQQVVIHANQPLQVQGDGEVIGQTPVEVTVAPVAVQVITPQAQKTEQADIGPGMGLGASFFQRSQKI
jgi:diacylglycerol kinase family enzyme